MRTRLIPTLVLAVAAAACWWVWMAWDTTGGRDPVTGAATGPYEAWQVIGCAVSLVAVTAFASTRLPWWIVVPMVPVAFTAAWTGTVAAVDDSGLFLVGTLLVLVTTLIGTAVVSGVTALALRRRTELAIG